MSSLILSGCVDLNERWSCANATASRICHSQGFNYSNFDTTPDYFMSPQSYVAVCYISPRDVIPTRKLRFLDGEMKECGIP